PRNPNDTRFPDKDWRAFQHIQRRVAQGPVYPWLKIWCWVAVKKSRKAWFKGWSRRLARIPNLGCALMISEERALTDPVACRWISFGRDPAPAGPRSSICCAKVMILASALATRADSLSK